MDTRDPAAAKQRLRRRILSERARLPADRRAAAALALADAAAGLLQGLPARTVATYAARADEPDTGPLVDRLLAIGVEVLLPVVRAGGRLDWAVYRPGLMRPGRFGIQEPVGRVSGAGAFGGADVALVPALAVDHAGHRLGRGGGYIDRALRAGRPPLTLAVVYDEEILPEVPAGADDEKVDGALAPAGVSRPPTATS